MKYSLEFLCWVNRCLYPGDFIEDLVKHGMDRATATFLVNSKRKLDILDFYQDFCLNDKEISDVVESYLDEMLKKVKK